MDEQTIARYVAGDEHAFEELLTRHLAPAYSFVSQFVGNAEDAEDITQDAFFKIWKNIKKFDPKTASFKTWMMRIVRNTAVDYLRKKKSIPFSQFETSEGENVLEDTLVDSAQNPEEETLSKERAHEVQEAIQQLSLPQRELLLLYLQNDMTFTEIGDALGIPANTAKSRYRRSLIALKGVLHRIKS